MRGGTTWGRCENLFRQKGSPPLQKPFMGKVLTHLHPKLHWGLSNGSPRCDGVTRITFWKSQLCIQTLIFEKEPSPSGKALCYSLFQCTTAPLNPYRAVKSIHVFSRKFDNFFVSALGVTVGLIGSAKTACNIRDNKVGLLNHPFITVKYGVPIRNVFQGRIDIQINANQFT